MLRLPLPREARTVLCLGAHSDDIEIGCGGTIIWLRAERPDLRFHWIVLSAPGDREHEARESARLFLGHDHEGHTVAVEQFRDGFFPYDGGGIKEFFEALKHRVSPDLVFTHARWDRHQDHRIVNELTWNTFRDHFILEYEIPKYDGDLGTPNCFVPLDRATGDRKVEHLLAAFPSQREKRWFTPDTFRALLRLRGVESGTQDPYAEAYYAHKVILGGADTPGNP